MTYFYLSEKHVDQMMTPSVASGCQQDSKNSSDYHEIPVLTYAGRPFPVLEGDTEELNGILMKHDCFTHKQQLYF